MDFFNVDNIIEHFEVQSYELQLLFKIQVFLMKMLLYEYVAIYEMVILIVLHLPSVMIFCVKESIIYELIDYFVLEQCRRTCRKYFPSCAQHIFATFVYVTIRYGFLRSKVKQDSAHRALQ